MKKMLICVLAVGLLFTISSQADAFIVIDTGHTADTDFLAPFGVATRFVLNGPVTVTSIKSWLSGVMVDPTAPPGDSLARLTVYGDGRFFRPAHTYPDGNIPDLDNILFGASFQLPNSSSDDSVLSDYAWRGITGMSLDLPAGNYWVGIRTAPDSHGGTIGLGVPGTSISARAGNNDYLPVGQGETCDSDGCRPNDDPRFNYSLRVNAVPEPSTILLFGTGLLGVFYRRRRRS